MRRPLLWAVVVALVIIDLLTKSWAFAATPVGDPPIHITSWFAIRTLTNPGGIWGMGAAWTTALTLIRVCVVGALAWLILQQTEQFKSGAWTLALLLSGAVGNLYDNLSAWMPWPGNGEVRDFLDVHFAAPGWYPVNWVWPFNPWPTFNFADACISIGFVLLVTGIAKVHLGKASDESDCDADKTNSES